MFVGDLVVWSQSVVVDFDLVDEVFEVEDDVVEWVFFVDCCVDGVCCCFQLIVWCDEYFLLVVVVVVKVDVDVEFECVVVVEVEFLFWLE